MTDKEILLRIQKPLREAFQSHMTPVLGDLFGLLRRVYDLERAAYSRGEPFLPDDLAGDIQAALGDPDPR